MSYFAPELGELFIYVGVVGIGAAGKSTNVKALRSRTAPALRGRALSVHDFNASCRQDMWDFGHPTARVSGAPVRLHVWWRGGLHFDENIENHLLRGNLDGLVIVVDSQKERLEANGKYFEMLGGLVPEELWSTTAIQYNKRDLPNAAPINKLQGMLNPDRIEAFEAVATEGTGVLETFESVSSRILAKLNAEFGVPTMPISG